MREIVKLIHFSPKRKHLFSGKLSNEGETKGVNIKPLCLTGCTVRTGAIDALLKDYAVVMDTMENDL